MEGGLQTDTALFTFCHLDPTADKSVVICMEHQRHFVRCFLHMQNRPANMIPNETTCKAIREVPSWNANNALAAAQTSAMPCHCAAVCLKYHSHTDPCSCSTPFLFLGVPSRHAGHRRGDAVNPKISSPVHSSVVDR
jgi:hypothetical protein